MVAMAITLKKEVLSGVQDAACLTESRGMEMATGKVRSSGEVSSDELSSKSYPPSGGDMACPAKIGVDDRVLVTVQDNAYGGPFLVPDSTLIPAL